MKNRKRPQALEEKEKEKVGQPGGCHQDKTTFVRRVHGGYLFEFSLASQVTSVMSNIR
jgi:hypothetical protein